jgi:hypothetical protein
MSRSPTLTPPPAADDGVAGLGRIDEDIGQSPLFVASPAEVDGLETVGPQACQQAGTVAVPDLSRCQPARPRHELVPRRDHADPGPGEDVYVSCSETGQDTDVSRSKAFPGREDLLPGGEVLARVAHVGTRADGLFDQDPTVLRPGVLDHAHGVGAYGHSGAGHDAYRFAFAYDHTPWVVAGHEPPDHCEPNGGLGHVCGPERITVHRRVGKRRDRFTGDNGPSSDQAQGVAQSHLDGC